jgi:hypothetical protein
VGGPTIDDENDDDDHDKAIANANGTMVLEHLQDLGIWRR